MQGQPLTGNRYLRGAALAALVAGVLAGSALRPAVAGAQVLRADATPAAEKKSREAAKRARIRRLLTRQLRHNPTVVFKRSFIKQAEFVDFKLPFTVRLGRSNGLGGYEPSDDEVELTWDDAANPWPLAPSGQPAAVQTLMLGGRYTMEADFGGDASGTGVLGDIETSQGRAISMTSNGFTISDFDPFCNTGPQLITDPANDVVVTSSGPRYGVMNMFSQTMRGSLSLRMTFAAEVNSSCGGTPAATPTVDNSTAPAMPLHFNGRFNVSPGITADGKVRLGRMTIDDTVTPQTSTFAFVRSCTGTATCDPFQFPARLKVKKLTAEVLLGDIGPA